MLEEMIWSEKYRPKAVSDVILPDKLKATFQKFVDDKTVPNLILAGGPGMGKTTVAKAMLEQLGCDCIVINGSLDGNIDTLRNQVLQFASSVSFAGGKKYVIFDEADYLNAQSVQPALRGFMEQFSRNCGFIFTCNYKNRLIEPLHSRTSVIDFKFDKSDIPALAAQLMKKIIFILNAENIEYEKAVLVPIITKYFPDFRRTINEIQRYSAISGKIDSGILGSHVSVSVKELMGSLKEKNFTAVRKWVAENSDDVSGVFRSLYDAASEYITPQTIPILVVTLAKYQYQSSFAADQEINLSACLVELMMEISFK